MKKNKEEIGFFRKSLNFLSELFFPSKIKCLMCGRDLPEKQNIEFCKDCAKKFEFIDENCCKTCGTKLKLPNICLNCTSNKRHFDLARSVFVYDQFSAKLIKRQKYSNRPYYSSTLSELLAQKFKQLGWEVDFVVPVPVTKKTKKSRGFNQSELLADKMAEICNLEVLKDVLVKVKETKHQASLGYKERQENLRSSFDVVDKDILKDKIVLLIDDVFTTGATAGACAKKLKEFGAKKVFVLTPASTKSTNFEN